MGNGILIRFGWAACVLGAMASVVGAAPGPVQTFRNALIVNEDNSHFFGSRTPEQMTEAGLHAFVDQYADTAVTHLFLCPNAMRASFRSRTREAIWTRSKGNPIRVVGRTMPVCSASAGSTRTPSGLPAAARRASRPGCRCA